MISYHMNWMFVFFSIFNCNSILNGCILLVWWQLMALLLLRDALNLTTNSEDEDDPTAFFSVCTSLLTFPTSLYHLWIYFFKFLGDFDRFFLCLCSLVSTAFPSSCCWLPPPMLHHGMGHRYTSTSETKTGVYLKNSLYQTLLNCRMLNLTDKTMFRFCFYKIRKQRL